MVVGLSKNEFVTFKLNSQLASLLLERRSVDRTRVSDINPPLLSILIYFLEEGNDLNKMHGRSNSLLLLFPIFLALFQQVKDVSTEGNLTIYPFEKFLPSLFR